MKKSIITIFFSIIIISSIGQVKFFVEASANYSFFNKVEKSNDNIIQPLPGMGYSGRYNWSKLIEDYDSKPGFDILVGLQKNISKKFNIESSLGLSMINYKRKDETIYHKSPVNNPFNVRIYGGIRIGEPFGNITSTGGSIIGTNEKIGNTNIYYLTIPVILNYRIFKNKLSIGAGISSSIIIHSKQFKNDYDIYNRNAIEKNTTSDGLTNFVLSCNFKIGFRMLKKIWIIANYQHAFSPVYDEGERFAGDAKVRLIKLGLRYYI